MKNSASLNTNELREITMWHVCGLSLCNFDCSYCASGIPGKSGNRTRDREWQSPSSKNEFRQFVAWLEKQPYSIGLRLQTIGEPFVSKSFLEGAAQVSKFANIRFIELVTNGSLLIKRLPILIGKYEGQVHKISLWITYHHSEISVDDLIEQVIYAKKLGFSLVVNCLLFPDNLNKIREIIKQCKLNSIRYSIDLGQNLNASYPGQPYFSALKELSEELALELEMDFNTAICSIIAKRSPRGFKCSAGYDYVFVDTTGAVFPCRPYQRIKDRMFLGSVLDPKFILNLRAEEYQRCLIQQGCVCKEDFMHMKLAREEEAPKSQSLGLVYPGLPPKNKMEILNKIKLVQE